MHAFNFTCPSALVLAIICLATAVPTSEDIHADPGSGAVIHTVGNVPESAVIKDTIATTHLTAAILPTDETGGSTLKPDSAQCVTKGKICSKDSDCCKKVCFPVPFGNGGVCMF
ncbi:uncharacterized protein LACBIDRAFT_329967 [Laccaria bicolor S238N-H82]|uniref:Predicted protein n=1 Tax=Laccaria bicolor (strain S238N-H82 / ATCC MYA-4686) TaxID=486041 RepID=B0DJS7_LACBS|nr:uncharacterized protein LACBIDRAFT_329967 [Laccaria bicolor S238N-H82]EDR05170.1 predicted protein [Laccaria bicolor S238N-H82]|eukprot:XP_001884135.1 predicted protein [Laccaria bicolor S238N-H82]